MGKINIDSPSDVIVLTIVTIPGNGQSPTTNLEGPLVINKKNNQAIQAILSDSKWMTKHVLSVESVKGGVKC